MQETPSDSLLIGAVVELLTVSSSINCNRSTNSCRETMSWALANMEETGEGAYTVRHGHKFVRNFGVRRSEKESKDARSYVELAFLMLSPYGRGGFEQEHDQFVSMSDHIQWALQYHDC